MSLTEIIGTPKYQAIVTKQAISNYNTYGQSAVQGASVPYQLAVEAVKTAPKGTVISTAPKVSVKAAIPSVAKDILTSPVQTGIQLSVDAYNLLLGSRQTKAETAAAFVPAVTKTETTDMGKVTVVQQDFTPFLTALINEQKANDTAMQKFWSTATLGNTNIQIPEIKIPDITIPEIKFPDIFGGITDALKGAIPYLIIGGAAIIGILIFTRRKK